MLKLTLPKCFYIIGVSWLQNTDLQMKAYELGQVGSKEALQATTITCNSQTNIQHVLTWWNGVLMYFKCELCDTINFNIIF